jgi:hypothetical protein
MARFPDCSAALAALASGLDERLCHSFRDLRSVVMCRAWEEFRGGRAPTFHDAVRDGWGAVRAACAAHGGTTPEAGFLQPEAPAAPAVTHVSELRRNGLRAGLLVHHADGTVTACLEDRCLDVAGGTEAMDALRSLLEVAGYQVVEP